MFCDNNVSFLVLALLIFPSVLLEPTDHSHLLSLGEISPAGLRQITPGFYRKEQGFLYHLLLFVPVEPVGSYREIADTRSVPGYVHIRVMSKIPFWLDLTLYIITEYF